MKIISIVGARPEFIQAWPVSKALEGRHEEILVHTGQHYDHMMSDNFFEELGIQEPAYNLGVGSGTHARQTGDILVKLETVLLSEKPDLVIIRGDTNSTLAGALAASKLMIPIAHIEAGERSYNRNMPEEINRIVSDCVATLHFCASETAVKRLAKEGITESVYWVGDVMLDAFLLMRDRARTQSNVLDRLRLHPGEYALVTIHRAGNTENPDNIKSLVEIMNRVEDRIVFPVHPRTATALDHLQTKLDDHITVIRPVGYFDMIILEGNAKLIATDSGGVQREAYFSKVPCLTLRDETEWVETVEAGWNKIVGTDPDKVLAVWKELVPPSDYPHLFGNGSAAYKIVEILDDWRG